jgi:hypothetical protein
MRTLTIELGTLNLRWAVVALGLMVCNECTAQIQQAWVARYNNGITNGTNQAVKMALDSSGNIYVTGFSQNSITNLGYVTIKYAPNGNLLWASRYDSTNFPSAAPAALVLDGSNDVIVTGNALTIKYDPNGNQLWTAPYAGSALAVDSNANVYAVGFSKDFGTVKLSPQGSNLWLTTLVEPYGPTVSQSVLVDSGNNVYVSGLDSYFNIINNGIVYGPYVMLTTIKSDSNGNQLWKASEAPYQQEINVQVKGAALDSANNLCLVCSFAGTYNYAFNTIKYATNGNITWTAALNISDGLANGLALDRAANVLLVGQNLYALGFYGPYNYYSTTIKMTSFGTTIWTNHFPEPPGGLSVGTSVAVDWSSNIYISGYSSGTNSNIGIMTIKYAPNGNQIWLQRYNGPGNGNDAGNAITVDNNGNVYVAGYDTTTAGGTEMVLIKYSPVVLQRRPDGTVLLQTEGSPGESFEIQASADLLNWLDLGSVLADTNGLMQFFDTNAPNYASRFYTTSPQ